MPDCRNDLFGWRDDPVYKKVVCCSPNVMDEVDDVFLIVCYEAQNGGGGEEECCCWKPVADKTRRAAVG